MSVAEYYARFLMLKRFVLCYFASESVSFQSVSFPVCVLGLHISLRLVVTTFSCLTLAKAVIRALECEHVHLSHHQTRTTS